MKTVIELGKFSKVIHAVHTCKEKRYAKNLTDKRTG